VSRLLAQLERERLRQEHARLVAEALLTGAAPSGARSAALDPQRARAIPIVGPSSPGGHVPGTRPGSDAHLTRMDCQRR
jgi:hypothetical protein